MITHIKNSNNSPEQNSTFLAYTGTTASGPNFAKKTITEWFTMSLLYSAQDNYFLCFNWEMHTT